MNTEVQNFLQGKSFAVVGVSRNDKKFGSSIYTEMKSHGLKVFAVNPAMTEFAGDPCYPNVGAINDKVDGVVVCLPTSKGADVVKDVAAAGIKNLWLQQGADSPALVKQAQDLGLSTVAGKCIFMYLEPVKSVHGFHRFFARLFGQI
jgi:uncharacterized protein